MKADPIVDQYHHDNEADIDPRGYLDIIELLNVLPVGVCSCDANGFITDFNNKAEELWGRAPIRGDKSEKYFGAYKLYNASGLFMEKYETSIAACLSDGIPRNEQEMIIERPDHSLIIIKMNVAPIKNKDGAVSGVITCFSDITEQRKTEKELYKKTTELRDYVENATIGLHWVDANGIIKWANKAEMEMLGYKEDEYIGHHISEFHADEDKVNDILNRLSCNETLKSYETILRCKDGTTRTVQISSNVFWEEGKFIHTRCFTIDITEQKRFLEALKESESKYKQLVEGIKTAIYTTDAQGRITLYNKAAAELWGREPEIGKDFWCGSYNILKADGSELPLDSCPIAIALKEQRAVVGEEIIVVRADGSLRNVAPHPQPFFDASGKLAGAVNMLVDITNIKKNEQALRESEKKLRELNNLLERKVEERTKDLKHKIEELKKSEERYHKMVNEVEDYAILLLDKDGTVQNWNTGAEKIKGYKAEDIVGKNFRVFYKKEDREKGLPDQLLSEAREKGKALHEGWRVRKDGSTFWGSIVITALHDADNNIVGFSKVTRDLTERKLAEDRLSEYAKKLEFQNKELEQFAYAASHDMKEPLRKITFYNQYIADYAANELNEKLRDYLNRSLSAAKRMSKLIEDLLTYSRANSSNESFEETNLNKIVEEIILSYKDAIEQNEVQIELGQLPVVKVIPFQFRQLMDNIITNSIKYKHPDRLTLIRINSEIVKGSEVKSIEADKSSLYHKITIEDNGLGFEDKYGEKIFEIFQRLTNNSDYKGSGIGLAMCKKIVQNHGGFIKATGKVNEGAVFEVYIPTKQNQL